jgi:hypothetical protein
MVTGYKCFNENLQCYNQFQYDVGKRYKHEGKISLCRSGFHFCRKAQDVFSYYDFDIKNRVCEIIAHGEVFDMDNKSVTNDIEIVRELTWNEVLKLVNSGKANSGLANSGNRNSGYRNSGNRNSGDLNSGDLNSGDLNSGNRNSGNRNSGDRNSGYGNSGDRNLGYRNSGNRNAGNWNSGDLNTGNRNSGLFCSNTPTMRIFNKQTDIEFEEFHNDGKYHNIRSLLYDYEFPLTYWLSFDDMTEEEKEEYKQYTACNGVLLKRDYKTACELWWKEIPENLKQELIEWEWFDAEVFEEITGIKVK